MRKGEKLVRVCKIRQGPLALLATGCLTNMFQRGSILTHTSLAATGYDKGVSRLISLLAAARRGAKEGQEQRNATKGEDSKGRRQGRGVSHKIHPSCRPGSLPTPRESWQNMIGGSSRESGQI